MNISPRARGGLPAAGADDRETYQHLHRLQMEEFARRLPHYAARFYWPREQIQAERERALRRLLAIAKQKSPWHAMRLGRVDPDTFTASDLPTLPTMTKADLMGNFAAIATERQVSLAVVEDHLASLTRDAYLFGDYHAVTSSGSSGERGIFLYDWEAWQVMGLSSARSVPLMGFKEGAGETLASLIAINPSSASAAFTQSFAPWLSRVFEKLLVLPVTLPFPEILERLNALQPTVISGFPSIIYQLCHAARAGKLKIAPRAFLLGAEPLYPHVREALAREFRAPVYNFYGCSEASCLAFSCPEGHGLHLSDDLVIFEPVDEKGAPVPPGARSAKVLITNLFNALQPLIRYELSDSVTVLEDRGRCACGSYLRKIGDVEGRADDSFIYDGGVFVHPVIFAEPLGHESAILAYQVRQTKTGAEVLVQLAGACDCAGLSRVIEARLSELGIEQAEVSVEPVKEIARGAGGKLKQFVRAA